MRKNKIYILIIAILSFQIMIGQDQFVDDLNKMPNFVNPSFYGFKSQAKIGLANKFPGKTFVNALEYSYGYGSAPFEYNNFSLGLDVFNSRMSNSGYNSTEIALTYVYRVQLNNNWYFHPAITVGYSTASFNYDKLIFQDQIDIFSDQINLATIDPLAASSKIKYADIGASFMMHNDENFLFGFSLDHINRPNISIDEEVDHKLDMLISAQVGYEFDINPYDQNVLPEESYLYLFANFSNQSSSFRMDFYQQFNLAYFGLGISEHLNYLDEFGIHKMGFNADFHFDFFDLGLTFQMPITQESKYIVNNSLELYMIFDLDPFRSGRRGNFSVFY